MELTPNNVQNIFQECLFLPSETPQNCIEAEGVRSKVFFHPERLKYNEAAIESFLNQLPDEFKEGWSFLNMCYDKNGNLWTGEHCIIDLLITMGIAIGKLSFFIPREQWYLLPGGMPYILINKQ